jgi:DNA-binding beta-propeller fold protein YncE
VLLALALLSPVRLYSVPDLIVSVNDAKLARKTGVDSYPENPGSDTLNLIDASNFPPKIIATLDVATSIAGPPQAVAIAPSGKIAVVSATNHYDYQGKKVIADTYLQVVDLEAKPARVVSRIELGQHPQGLSINRAGTLLLAATLGGTVAVLSIKEKTVTLREQLKIAEGRLSGVTFTTDGRAALVCLRDEQGILVLNVNGAQVTTERERIASGVAPYAIDVSSDGRWAVVSNVGLAGLAGNVGKMFGDVDTITLIDVARRPFRAVQHLTVPAVPEAVAISPNGRWIVAQTMNGSNLTADNPGRQAVGRLVLFEIKNGQAVPSDSVPGGEAAQGLVFTADNRYLIAQFNVDRQLAVFEVRDGKLRDTKTRLPVTGGPTSIRSLPR